MTNYYTEDLTEFGYREIKLLHEILTAWINNGLPEGFYHSSVRPAMNKSSGNVFLVNDDYQVAMMNGDQLAIFHTLPDSGIEGFLTDLLEENDPEALSDSDALSLFDAAELSRIDLGPIWSFYRGVYR